MSISSVTLATIVIIALAITVIAPIALVVFWIKDWRNKQLW